MIKTIFSLIAKDSLLDILTNWIYPDLEKNNINCKNKKK